MIKPTANILAEQSGLQLLVAIAIGAFALLSVMLEKLKQQARPPTERPAPAGVPGQRRPVVRPQPPRQRVRQQPGPSAQRPPVPPPVQQVVEALAGAIQQAAGPADSAEVTVRRVPEQTAFPVERAGPFRKPTPAELRRAIILNEILGPPMALRNESAERR